MTDENIFKRPWDPCSHNWRDDAPDTLGGPELPGRGQCYGYLTAYRRWIVSRDGLLWSQFRYSVWWPDFAMRGDIDKQTGNETPCGGVFALKAPPSRRWRIMTPYWKRIMLVQDRWTGVATEVYGSVALWGRIAHHKNGYRAQYAYPLAIHGTLELEYGKREEHEKLLPLVLDVCDRFRIPYREEAPSDG